MRWQVKDVVDYPLEDTEVDVFYPDESNKSLKKIYVIAARSSFLRGIAGAVQEAGLSLISTDVREFDIRDLS